MYYVTPITLITPAAKTARQLGWALWFSMRSSIVHVPCVGMASSPACMVAVAICGRPNPFTIA